MKIVIVVMVVILLLTTACGSIPTQEDGTPAPLHERKADSGLTPTTGIIIVGLGLLLGFTLSGG